MGDGPRWSQRKGLRADGNRRESRRTVVLCAWTHSFTDVCESPGELLQTVKGNVKEYVKCICSVIF